MHDYWYGVSKELRVKVYINFLIENCVVSGFERGAAFFPRFPRGSRPWQRAAGDSPPRQGRTGERASEIESYGVYVSAREMKGRGSRLSVSLALTQTP